MLKTFLVMVVVAVAPLRVAAAQTVVEACPPPSGSRLVLCPDSSFGAWLQTLPVKGDGVILAHDGTQVTSSIYSVWAVVDLPLMFTSDIEQCADYAMRLWAEYHRDHDRLDKLSLFNYSGEPVQFSGSGKSYRSFMRRAFAYSNSHSLKVGCEPVPDDSIQAGDLFVQNEKGGIGHVSVILAACTDSAGTARYLIGFSFMPAQEFHIERADDEYGQGGWFTLEGFRSYLFDNLNLGVAVVRRFGGGGEVTGDG